MMYNPREYWAERLQETGPTYVAFEGHQDAFDKQAQVFWDVIEATLPAGRRVLDFGFGVGRFAPLLAEVFDFYNGVDLNPGVLEHAPELPNASFTYLEEDKLPFVDDLFDAVVAITVIQHIVSPDQFSLWTAEIGRVVKPGGYIFIIDDPQYDAKGKKVRNATHMCRRTPEIIADAIGAYLEVTGKLSAECEDSHYYFLARKM
jgi:ubiquinone/menaquinone biosynthesis C-methylase UbiE